MVRVAGQLGEVGVVLVLADDLHLEQHPRVVGAAELVALAGEGAGLGRGHLEPVVTAGDDVHPHRERRDAEVVDHVRAVEVELDGAVDRQHERRPVLTGAGDVDVGALRRVDRVGVVEGPLPLLADDRDRHVGIGIHLQHGVLHPHGVREEDDDHDDREDRVEDLDRQVVARLDRDLVVAATPEVPRRAEDQAPGDDTRHEGGDPRALPQVQVVPALLGDGIAAYRAGQPGCRQSSRSGPARVRRRRPARPLGAGAGPVHPCARGASSPRTSLPLDGHNSCEHYRNRAVLRAQGRKRGGH